MKKKQAFFFLANIIVISTLLSIGPLVSGEAEDIEYNGVQKGQVLIWKIESTETTSFLKANVSFVNNTAIKADQYEYNQLGIESKKQEGAPLSLILPNQSFNYIIQQFGNNLQNKTFAERNVTCVVYELEDQDQGKTTKIFYDYQTGILCSSETTIGDSSNKTTLVSWRNADVSQFANLTPIIAGSVAGGVVLIGLVIYFIKKRKKD